MESVRFETRFEPDGSNPRDIIRIKLETGGEMSLFNSGWTVKNPALRFIAFHGERPTTLDALAGKQTPVVYDADGYPQPPQFVMDRGADELQEAWWFESDD